MDASAPQVVRKVSPASVLPWTTAAQRGGFKMGDAFLRRLMRVSPRRWMHPNTKRRVGGCAFG